MMPYRSPFAPRAAAMTSVRRIFGEPNGGSRKALPDGEGGANKFNARKTTCSAGHKHDSKREAGRCDQLHLLQRGGVISALECQPQFWFVIDGRQVFHVGGRRAGYKPDFAYVEAGRSVVEESKPRSKAARGSDYALRRAIFCHLFPHIDFREVA